VNVVAVAARNIDGRAITDRNIGISGGVIQRIGKTKFCV
jgi:hypothetical protein